MEARVWVSDSIETNGPPCWILWSLWYSHSSSAVSPHHLPPPPHQPSLLCLSACLTCVNPSQAARRSVHSRWFMAAEAWLHRRERSSKQTGGSICLVRGWLSRHPAGGRAGGRASEGAEKAQPATLGPSPRDLTGKTAMAAMAMAVAAESNAGNRSISTRDLHVSNPPPNPGRTYSWKHPTTDTWALGWRRQVKGYKFDERLHVLLRLQVIKVFQQFRLGKLGSWNEISFHEDKNSSFCTCQAELVCVVDSW